MIEIELAVYHKWLANILHVTYRIPAQEEILQRETSGYKLRACDLKFSSFIIL